MDRQASIRAPRPRLISDSDEAAPELVTSMIGHAVLQLVASSERLSMDTLMKQLLRRAAGDDYTDAHLALSAWKRLQAAEHSEHRPIQ